MSKFKVGYYNKPTFSIVDGNIRAPAWFWFLLFAGLIYLNYKF
jgi:hypothetical protein